VVALQEEALRLPLPATVKLYADFERPGVCRFASRLGVRHVSMGCHVRAWADVQHEVGQVIAACNKGHFDTVIVWTVNDETKLRELVRLGGHGIMTDDPALLHRIVVE
jgi:glycerophosphoryl diester phosphodiesterase